MNETAEKLIKAFAVKRTPPVCQQQRDFLLQCYKQNPDQPLLCSDTVKKFSNCVHSARMVRCSAIHISSTNTFIIQNFRQHLVNPAKLLDGGSSLNYGKQIKKKMSLFKKKLLIVQIRTFCLKIGSLILARSSTLGATVNTLLIKLIRMFCNPSR